MQKEEKKRVARMNCKLIGNTPIVPLSSYDRNELFLKLEGVNVFGSAKDRAAIYVLEKLLKEKVINQDTEIIESSSGNMGVALAGVCGMLKLKLTVVIDVSIAPINEFLIRSMGANVIKVDTPDENNSYLKNRLQTVKDYLDSHDNVYWFNQYGNELIPEAYKNTLGKEIVRDLPDVEYVFVAVSSGGSICGISKGVKEYNPNIKVIAVDIKGSKIFEPETKVKKNITGIGSSIRADNLKRAEFDDYIVIDEEASFEALKSLLREDMIFAGGTSGCVVAGAKKYLKEHNIEHAKSLCILHDRGDRYFNTIYNNRVK